METNMINEVVNTVATEMTDEVVNEVVKDAAEEVVVAAAKKSANVWAKLGFAGAGIAAGVLGYKYVVKPLAKKGKAKYDAWQERRKTKKHNPDRAKGRQEVEAEYKVEGVGDPEKEYPI